MVKGISTGCVIRSHMSCAQWRLTQSHLKASVMAQTQLRSLPSFTHARSRVYNTINQKCLNVIGNISLFCPSSLSPLEGG